MLTSGFLTVAKRKYLDCRVGMSKSYLYSLKFHVTNGFAALRNHHTYLQPDTGWLESMSRLEGDKDLRLVLIKWPS